VSALRRWWRNRRGLRDAKRLALAFPEPPEGAVLHAVEDTP